MARNVTTFESGNKVGLLLTPEISELFINTVKQTGRISIAAGRCCIGTRTARDWLRKGREPDAEPIYREFADDVEGARAEFLALAAKRLAQLAIGGTIDLPAYDKQNRLIRDAEGEIIFEPRYFPPNPNALMHILDRVDPQPNLEPPTLDVPMPPEQSDAEALAEAAQYFDLFRESFKVMAQLGMEPPAEWKKFAIETSATKVEVEPVAATLGDNASSKEPETPTDPPKPDPEAF